LRTLTVTAVAAMLAFAVPCTVAAPNARSAVRAFVPGSPPPVIPFGEREAPILDQLWALTPKWTMATRDHYEGKGPWSPNDLSVQAQFQYDEAGLWMRFIVTDNVFHQKRRGRDFWQGDSVQVSIQAGVSKAALRHSFGFALTPDGPKAIRYSGPPGFTGTVDVLRRGVETVYDARVPWPDLAPLKPEAGRRFRMNFLVNDNDGKGRHGRMEWSAGMGQGDDASKWMEWSLGLPGPEPTSM
jgi:hypothetical protein